MTQGSLVSVTGSAPSFSPSKKGPLDKILFQGKTSLHLILLLQKFLRAISLVFPPIPVKLGNKNPTKTLMIVIAIEDFNERETFLNVFVHGCKIN